MSSIWSRGERPIPLFESRLEYGFSLALSSAILDRESFHEMMFERMVKEGGLEVRARWALLLAA